MLWLTDWLAGCRAGGFVPHPITLQVLLKSINLGLEDSANKDDLDQGSSPPSVIPTPSIQISSRRKPIDEDFQEKLEEYEKDLAIKLRKYGEEKGSTIDH